jgi:arylsulfatase A-like enzyme
VAVLAAVVAAAARRSGDEPPLRSFAEQACGLPSAWLERIRRGHYGPRSGDISLLPRRPAYFASGAGGWSHSGPWPYLAHVPLVFYGPEVIRARGDVHRSATLADVAPTVAGLLGARVPGADGEVLPEVAGVGRPARSPRPRLVVVVVWDGGGWNVLDHFPGAWPNLRRLMAVGVTYRNATVGSSPSVTPSVHTTLGTGQFPSAHGITGIPVRNDDGEVVDSFLHGRSGRFLRVPTFAERWDERFGNRARVGMVGYEPWHLGMIGRGAERAGGDRDDAVWLDVETNRWETNAAHYRLPPALPRTTGLARDIHETDAVDGEVDGAWRDHAILTDPARREELPGFIRYHGRALENVITSEGYGDDRVTDLLFTNFKQIDRVGHYFNMDSVEVRDSVVVSDEVLGDLVSFLDDEVGSGRYVVVVTADHGQQPDAGAVDGYGIDPNEVERDLAAEFGDVVRGVWPTEVFLLSDAMAERGVSAAEVARFLGDYRLADNTRRPDIALVGAGRFEPDDRLFDMAVPSAMLRGLRCGRHADG